MAEETFTETVGRYRRLLEQQPNWTPDEAAQAAANEGQSVLSIVGILRNVFEVPLREAMGAALYAVHGSKYGQPVNSKPSEK
ncbi:hypothetical protein Q0M94_28130 (plasmid) [Deinococcus radiomollis]|uniref:hypothetical protein n=1 Tax=Deinococcus radiomollis TaxID=468916 RepID=UPI003891D885